MHGYASKAREKAGWKPRVHFREIQIVVDVDEADVRSALAGRPPKT